MILVVAVFLQKIVLSRTGIKQIQATRYLHLEGLEQKTGQPLSLTAATEYSFGVVVFPDLSINSGSRLRLLELMKLRTTIWPLLTW